MVAANVISIEITTTDKAGLTKLRKQAQEAGKDIETELGGGFERAERRQRQATNQMSTAFKGSVGQMTRELDKLERTAALSGEGMSEEYATALAKVRADLATVSAEAARTGRNFDEGLSGAMRSIKRSVDDLRPPVQQLDKVFDQTARQIERDLQSVEKRAWSTGHAMDDAFTTSLRDIRKELDRVRTDAAQTGAGLQTDLGNALKQVKQQAADLSDSISAPTGGRQGGGLIESLLGDVPKGMAAATILGTGAAKFLWEGMQAEWEEDRVGGLIAAQTGAATTAAEGLGDRAGEVFADNFGSSVEEVGQAMSAIFENKLISTDAPAAEIEDLTSRVITLSQVMGEGFDRVSYSANQMVRNGIAPSVTAALDMIGEAQERGLNASGDLLDTVDEYSTKFRDLGLSGADAFGLIEQAMEGGARNTDIAADALKEFAIRAQDGSDLTRRGFQALGLDAKTMASMIAQGGDTARQAFDMTLDRLRTMPPSVERSTAAVDLFGTKAEDLGNALYSMDLDAAAERFENFGGTLNDMIDKIDQSTSFWDKMGRNISSAAASVGEFLDKDLGEYLDDMPELKSVIDEISAAQRAFSESGDIRVFDDLIEKYPDMASAVDAYVDKQRASQKETKGSTSVTQEYIATLEELINAEAAAAGKVMDLSDAQIGWHQSLADANEAAQRLAGQGVNATRTAFDLSTEAGRELEGTLYDVADGAFNLIESMQQNAATTEEIQGAVQSARDQFIQMAQDMGLSEEAAIALADKLRLIPGNYKAVVTVETQAALANLAAYKRALDNIPRTITTTTYVRGANISGSGGKAFLGQAHGGIATVPHMSAQTGGARHRSTMVNEAGPEVAEYPDGTRVLTAGATRALAEAGAFSMGGGGAQQFVFSWEGGDSVMRAIMQGIRVIVKNDHGGSATAAFNQRGVD